MKGKIKNSLVLILGLILILSTTTYAESFSDVKKSAWYYESVKELASRGGIAGYGDGSFKPNEPITFAEFLKMSLSSATENEYPSKKGNHWVSKAYEAAVDQGIISRKDFPAIKEILDKNITREDMTLILNNINLKIQGENNLDISKTVSKIKDIHKVDPKRRSCVLQAYEKGLIVGKPDGFDPKGHATRAEAAEVIMRMLEKDYRQFMDKEIIKTNLKDPNLSIGNDVLKLVNEERKKTGLAPLTLCKNLSKVAFNKSMDMAANKYFSHNSPRYGSPFDMMKEFKINYSYAGENIAKGHSDAKAVVKGWMNSPGHRGNILDSNFNTMGIGYINSNNTSYWTQMFTD